MKSTIALLFILFLNLATFGQINPDLPDPIETYSKDSKRLIKLSGLLGKINNGKRNFSGKISRVQWDSAYHTVYFDIGNRTFELDFSNVSNVTRSHLDDLIKKNNQVSVKAYAGGSNGIWLVINISQIVV